MASYSKKSYWNERYALETEPCDWIVSGYGVFHHLLSPTFLQDTNAPAPGGFISVLGLDAWQAPQCPLLTTSEEDEDEEEEKQEQHDESSINSRFVAFPLKEKCRVLHVGCGNSQLGEYMLHDGFRDIVNVDYSEVVINKMRERYDEKFFSELQECMVKREILRTSLGLVESRDDKSDEAYLDAASTHAPSMSFECGDITEGLHHYPDEAFDLIIAKKTLDVILCGAGSIANARSMLSECFRLLNKDHGVLMILSSAKPEDRAVYFENDPWTGVVNIKLPIKEDTEGTNQRKAKGRKRIDAYVYILYKQKSLAEHSFW